MTSNKHTHFLIIAFPNNNNCLTFSQSVCVQKFTIFSSVCPNFLCDNLECTNLRGDRCDGKLDCSDGSDEANCNISTLCEFVRESAQTSESDWGIYTHPLDSASKEICRKSCRKEPKFGTLHGVSICTDIKVCRAPLKLVPCGQEGGYYPYVLVHKAVWE